VDICESDTKRQRAEKCGYDLTAGSCGVAGFDYCEDLKCDAGQKYLLEVSEGELPDIE